MEKKLPDFFQILFGNTSIIEIDRDGFGIITASTNSIHKKLPLDNEVGVEKYETFWRRVEKVS